MCILFLSVYHVRLLPRWCSGILAGVMDEATRNWLVSAAGQAVLAELATRPLTAADLLREQTRLRASLPADYARAAIEQAVLRQHARTKLAHADQLYFTREALEQATSTPIAQHRAARFAGYGHIVEVGAGIGGDTLALAAGTHPQRHVTAFERDDVRAALLCLNVAALGLAARVTVVAASVPADGATLPVADALFCDPARRNGGRRQCDLAAYQPPLATVLAWHTRAPAIPAVGIKLAPGVDLAAVAQLAPTPHEIEFIALAGELKEAVLWCGTLATAATLRRATVLHRTPAGNIAAATLTPAAPRPSVPLSPPRAWLYEPDPAVIRAGLVAELALLLDASLLDPQIAYLTGDQPHATPFARAWPVIEWLPFQLKQLRARLHALDAGRVTVKKRGSPLDTDALARQLSGSGSRPLVVVLTRMQSRPIALIALPPTTSH